MLWKHVCKFRQKYFSCVNKESTHTHTANINRNFKLTIIIFLTCWSLHIIWPVAALPSTQNQLLALYNKSFTLTTGMCTRIRNSLSLFIFFLFVAIHRFYWLFLSWYFLSSDRSSEVLEVVKLYGCHSLQFLPICLEKKRSTDMQWQMEVEFCCYIS